MTEEQRARFIRESVGKTIASAEWDEDGAYWVFTFTDETDVSFRLMVDQPAARSFTVDGGLVIDSSRNAFTGSFTGPEDMCEWRGNNTFCVNAATCTVDGVRLCPIHRPLSSASVPKIATSNR